MTGRPRPVADRAIAGMAVLGLSVLLACVCLAHGVTLSWTDLPEATASIFRY